MIVARCLPGRVKATYAPFVRSTAPAKGIMPRSFGPKPGGSPAGRRGSAAFFEYNASGTTSPAPAGKGAPAAGGTFTGAGEPAFLLMDGAPPAVSAVTSGATTTSRRIRAPAASKPLSEYLERYRPFGKNQYRPISPTVDGAPSN